MDRPPHAPACRIPLAGPMPPRASPVLRNAFLAAIFSVVFHAVSSAADPAAFRVGFDIRNTQIEDARQYQPLLDYLGRKTGYRFEIRFARKGENIIRLLGAKEVDFAFIGAQSYLVAREHYGVIPVVRGLNSDGKAEYRSAIVTRPGSPVKGIRDLRGRKFAFGDKTSTQGHLIPLIVFAEHGMTLSDLSSYSFTGSHRNCARAVMRGEVDAGGMQDAMAMEYAREGLLRILFLSRFYPSSGVAANKSVPEDVLARTRRAFIDFRPKGRDAAGLYHWDKTEMPNGFVEAKDSDYAELRKFALRFGLLEKMRP